MKTPRRLFQILGLLAGLAGVAFFVHLLATTDALERLQALPPALLLLFPAFGFVALSDTVSWVYAFPRPVPPDRPRPGLWTLFTIRLAGESVNNALASAYVAGEPVKGMLAAQYGPRPAVALASALIGKTTTVLGEVLFLFVGVVVAAYVLDGDSPVKDFLLPVAAIGLVVVTVGIFVQSRRVFGRGARLLQALRLGSGRLWAKAMPGADAIDEAVGRYYAGQPGDFVLSTFWGFLGWLLGAGELWAFLSVATPVEDPLLLAVVLEAGIAVVKGLSFFIPGSMGAQEGGIAWLFQVTGAGLDAGVAYALFRRVREVFWIALGFASLGWYLRRVGTPSPSPESEPTPEGGPSSAPGPVPASEGVEGPPW